MDDVDQGRFVFPRALGRLRLAAPLIIGLVVLVESGAARPRELADSVAYDHPVIASLVGFGPYGPRSSELGTSLHGTLGLRYLMPEPKSEDLHATAFQGGFDVLSSGQEDIYTLFATWLAFLPRSNAFSFDHHLFYGAGVGYSSVQRRDQDTLLRPSVTFELGLQCRIRDWFLEPTVRYILAPQRAVYDMSGWAGQVSAAYHFDP